MPSFAFHINPQYEKLKVESLAQSSPADSDWLKSDSSSQNHVFKQKASQYPTIVQIDMPQPCNISCFIQSGHCIFAITKCYCILLQEFTLHSDCLGIVTIPEIYKYVTSSGAVSQIMSLSLSSHHHYVTSLTSRPAEHWFGMAFEVGSYNNEKFANFHCHCHSHYR